MDPSGLAKDPKIRPDIWGHGKKPDGSPKDPHVDYVDEKGKRRIRTAEEIKDPKQNIPRRHRKKVEEVLKIMLQKIDDLRSPILICPAHICNNPYFLPPTEYEPPMALLEENKKPLYCE